MDIDGKKQTNKTDRQAAERRRRKRNVGLLLILLGAILLGLFFLWQQQNARQSPQFAEGQVLDPPESTATPTPTPTPTPSPTPTPTPAPEPVEQAVDFEDLWFMNRDAYAYLIIPDTVVDYPVMQSVAPEDEDFYLEHTFERQAGLPGSLYTRRDNKKDGSDYITVIYGHDMMNGSFFGGLKQYEDKEYLEAHKTLYLYYPHQRFEYTVIAEAVFNDDSLTARYDIEKKKSVREFLRDARKMGEMVAAEDHIVEDGDRLLVLSTCIGSRPENRRLIIGRLEEIRPTLPYVPGSEPETEEEAVSEEENG